MTKTSFILLFAFLIFNTRCKKNDGNKDDNTIDVTQITNTDPLGNIISQIDNSDWTKDNNWTAAELALFETPTPAQLVDTQTADVSISPGYPNPVSSQQFLVFSTSKNTFLQIVITDNKLSVKKRLFFNTSESTHALTYLFDPLIFLNNTNYRLYYGFFSLADGLFYKGHGDIKISR